MKPLYIVAVCTFVLALVYAPIAAQTSETYEEGKDDDDDDDTWKKVAIILPIVFGGLSLLIFFCYCCCCAGAGQGWGCRDCSQWGCGDCRNCGNCGNCGDCRNCGAMCNCGDCRNCGDMCRCNCGDCGYCFGDCCRGCCMEPGYNGDNRVIYSSSQGPIRVEEAYNYRSQPPQAYNAGYSNDRTFVSSIPVNGVDRYPVSGGIRSGGDVYGGFGVYGNSPNYLSYPPVTRQAGCGCR